MNQGIIVAILSILFYLTNLLGGGTGQPMQPVDPPTKQQSYYVLGQGGKITADSATVRSGPSSEAEPLGTVKKHTRVTILDQNDNWYKIRPEIGSEGWIPEYVLTIQANQPKEEGQEILGYYPGGEMAYESLLNNGSRLTGVAPLGWELDSYGGLKADFDPEDMGRSLYFAGNQELRTYALVRVASSPSRLITTPYLQENSINQIINMLEEWGLTGVLLDLAYIPGTEQPQLFQFVETLATKLDQKSLRTILALPWDASIDYATASAAVDYLVLNSTAQQRGGNPGPSGAVSEMEVMLQEVVELVIPQKIILTIATGGLDWPRSGLPQPLSHKEILALAASQGASVKWDPEARTPFFKYGAGNEVWFENHYSVKYKLELAQKYNLGGIALLNLGQEDPEIWERL